MEGRAGGGAVGEGEGEGGTRFCCTFSLLQKEKKKVALLIGVIQISEIWSWILTQIGGRRLVAQPACTRVITSSNQCKIGCVVL